MNRFVIVDGLPYLTAGGKYYGVRQDRKGFERGAEVGLKSAPSITFSEVSINAKFPNGYDSITAEPEAEVVAKFDDMKLEELKAYAKEHGIKLNGARTKDAIIAVLNAQ